MNIQRESDGSLRVELTAKELQTFQLSYGQLNYQDAKTKRLLKIILEGAGAMTGFGKTQNKLLIEVFPAPEKGCILYFTHLEEKRKRYRQKLPDIYSFATCEAMLAALDQLQHRPAAKSELYWLDSRYLLILQDPAPISLSEYGDPMPANRLNLSYIREHGRLLAAPYAVEMVLNGVSKPSQ